MLESQAIEELHDHESAAMFVTDVVNRADGWVVQGRSSLRLATKSGQSLRIPGDFIGQKLERNKSMKTSVFGFVYHAHAAPAELLDDAVVRDGLADQKEGAAP